MACQPMTSSSEGRTHDSWNDQQPQCKSALRNLNSSCSFTVFALQKTTIQKVCCEQPFHMCPSGTWLYPCAFKGLCDLIKAHAIGLRRFNSCPQFIPKTALRWTEFPLPFSVLRCPPKEKRHQTLQRSQAV